MVVSPVGLGVDDPHRLRIGSAIEADAAAVRLRRWVSPKGGENYDRTV